MGGPKNFSRHFCFSREEVEVLFPPEVRPVREDLFTLKQSKKSNASSKLKKSTAFKVNKLPQKSVPSNQNQNQHVALVPVRGHNLARNTAQSADERPSVANKIPTNDILPQRRGFKRVQ
jgi:hypothetical protein